MVIGNLERRRLVRRTRSVTDRHFIEIRLSPEGARLIRRVFPAHAERLTGLMGGLTETEQRTLARLCRKLGIAAAAAPGSPGTLRRGR
jgi:MarR family 2-MHQ and catechol resistance regulon transcriptional repressor